MRFGKEIALSLAILTGTSCTPDEAPKRPTVKAEAISEPQPDLVMACSGLQKITTALGKKGEPVYHIFGDANGVYGELNYSQNAYEEGLSELQRSQLHIEPLDKAVSKFRLALNTSSLESLPDNTNDEQIAAHALSDNALDTHFADFVRAAAAEAIEQNNC